MSKNNDTSTNIITDTITLNILLGFVATHKFELQPTQSTLSLPIINRLYKKMRAGIVFLSIKVEHPFICDGHHRYIASLLSDTTLEASPGLLAKAAIKTNWKDVTFVEDDWDTEAKVKILNQRDAHYNNIPLKKLIELIS